MRSELEANRNKRKLVRRGMDVKNILIAEIITTMVTLILQVHMCIETEAITVSSRAETNMRALSGLDN